MPKIDLYGTETSSHVLPVLLTAAALDLEINWIVTDSSSGATRTDEYREMNPQHCIPTIKDGDFVLWESAAICAYLAHKYGGDSGMFPEDIEERALADRMVQFNLTRFSLNFKHFAYPIAFSDREPDNARKRAMYESIEVFDIYLEGHDFVVGDTVTYADHVLMVTAAKMESSGLDLRDFRNIHGWMNRCKKWPYYGVIQKGLDYAEMEMKEKLKNKF